MNAEDEARRCSCCIFIASPFVLARRSGSPCPATSSPSRAITARHPEYRTEWWYYTGHLRTESGQAVRIRGDVLPRRASIAERAKATHWDLQHLMPAHFAITDVAAKDFRYYEKLNRASPFTADAADGKLDVFNEGWRATTNPDGSWRLVAARREGRARSDAALAQAARGPRRERREREGAGRRATRRTTTR